MYYAIVSDIHSNLQAFTSVLFEIKKRTPDKIISPGDIVGYGANPSECLKLATEHCDEIVMGNHDQAVEDIKLREWFHPEAREAIEWTAGILSNGEKALIRAWTRLVMDEPEGITIAHGSPKEPEEYHYVFDSDEAIPVFRYFPTRICLIGHTHVPSLFSSTGEAAYLKEGKHALDPKARYLINPGSVEQHRDKNPKTSFAFYDSEKFELEIVRLDYENQKAAEKIRKAGLPIFLAERLL